MNGLKELIISLTDFYKINWYGFAAGHYFVWIVLGGLVVITLEAYLKAHKSKNDIRRFQENEHRG